MDMIGRMQKDFSRKDAKPAKFQISPWRRSGWLIRISRVLAYFVVSIFTPWLCCALT
jgi:hypothetical protein